MILPNPRILVWAKSRNPMRKDIPLRLTTPLARRATSVLPRISPDDRASSVRPICDTKENTGVFVDFS